MTMAFLSVIVIGRNEGAHLEKCLVSVFDNLDQVSSFQSEVIYVDSNSNDESIQVARGFEGVQVLQLKGDMNAAIARNAGKAHARGDSLLFLDADMELFKGVLPLFFSSSGELIHPFITGKCEDVYSSSNANLATVDDGLSFTPSPVSGGLIMIRTDIWDMVGGMKPEFKKSQDVDLALRLAKHGYMAQRATATLANHHTTAYLDKSRRWNELTKHLYGRSLLYRRHMVNPHIYRRLIQQDYSLLLLILSISISVALGEFWPLSIYACSILYRFLKKPTVLLFFVARDFLVLFGLILFYPKRKFHTQIVGVK